MTEERARRKLSGILNVDAAGYSRLMQEDEALTISALEEKKDGQAYPEVQRASFKLIPLLFGRRAVRGE